LNLRPLPCEGRSDICNINILGRPLFPLHVRSTFGCRQNCGATRLGRCLAVGVALDGIAVEPRARPGQPQIVQAAIEPHPCPVVMPEHMEGRSPRQGYARSPTGFLEQASLSRSRSRPPSWNRNRRPVRSRPRGWFARAATTTGGRYTRARLVGLGIAYIGELARELDALAYHFIERFP